MLYGKYLIDTFRPETGPTRRARLANEPPVTETIEFMPAQIDGRALMDDERGRSDEDQTAPRSRSRPGNGQAGPPGGQAGDGR